MASVSENTCITPEGWGTYDESSYSGLIHMVPNYGPAHYLTPTCWCHPDEFWKLTNLVVHNVAQ